MKTSRPRLPAAGNSRRQDMTGIDNSLIWMGTPISE
jgi:hypothetical protein